MLLELQNIKKSFGNTEVLKDFSLTLNEGDFFGFMGENGAGKTTLLKIAACLLQPDSGRIVLDGIEALENPWEARNHIGYVPDNFGLYEAMTVREYMEFYSSTYSLEGLKARNIYMDILKRMKLDKRLNDYVDTLSKGMKQRLCMGRAMIHNPDILILDEPFTGIDGAIREDMIELCREMSRNGKIVLFSSHQFADMGRICNKIGVLKDGKLQVCGTVDQINAQIQLTRAIVIRLLDDNQKSADSEKMWKLLRNNPKVHSISQQGGLFQVRAQLDETGEADLLTAIMAQKIRVLSFARKDNDLEEIFEQVMSKKERKMV